MNTEVTQLLLGMPNEFWCALLGAVVGALVTGSSCFFGWLGHFSGSFRSALRLPEDEARK